MDKKLTGKALAKFEAERDVWQEGPRGRPRDQGRRRQADESPAAVERGSRLSL